MDVHTTQEDVQKEIENLYNSINEQREKLVSLQRQAAAMEVQDYELKNHEGGTTKLSEMFGDKNDLIVIHNMGKFCPYCTLWADGFTGLQKHLENRTALAIVSPDSPEVQKEFAGSRDWQFDMYSAEGTSFIKDMGFEMEQNGQRYYMPGFSTFRKNADGSVHRVGKDFFGPGDVYNGLWHMFDFLQEGPGDWNPKFTYN